MTGRDDREEIDAAFNELISREWPNQSSPDGSAPADAPPGPSVAEPSAPQSEPSLFDWVDPNPDPEPDPEFTLDHVEPNDPGDDWQPANVPLESHFHGISPMGALGGALLVLSLVAIVCVVLFPSTRGIASLVAIGGFASGLLILLSRLPRQRPPSDGNGAVV